MVCCIGCAARRPWSWLRGVILIVVALVVITSLVNLPAFSWLVQNSLPALLLSVPVIFAPEIRRALERIGRAGTLPIAFNKTANPEFEQTVHTVVTAVARLSARQHGALIILQRLDNLDEYIQSGVRMDAAVTPELLLQIFYPNTPLHDGAAILSGTESGRGRLCHAALFKRNPEPLPRTSNGTYGIAPPSASLKKVMPSLWSCLKKLAQFPLRMRDA